jgi:hypothetical protein
MRLVLIYINKNKVHSNEKKDIITILDLDGNACLLYTIVFILSIRVVCTGLKVDMQQT